MDRRIFLRWVGVGLVASSLPVAIAACGPNTATSDTDESDTDAADAGATDADATGTDEMADAAASGYTPVGTVSELEQSGSLLNEDAASEPVLVIPAPDAADGYAAVNPVCTHAGCNVEWQVDQAQFVCPCHDSQFAPDGSVTQGPASEPLPSYPVTVEGEQILVQIS